MQQIFALNSGTGTSDRRYHRVECQHMHGRISHSQRATNAWRSATKNILITWTCITHIYSYQCEQKSILNPGMPLFAHGYVLHSFVYCNYKGYAMTSQTVINHCCCHPVAILSVNSITDALNKSGNLDCRYVKKELSAILCTRRNRKGSLQVKLNKFDGKDDSFV